MAEKRLNSCCARAVAGASLRDVQPTRGEIAWLFGITPRWVGELRKRGVLPAGAPLPELVNRMAQYRPEAEKAARKALLSRAAAAKRV